MPAPPVFVISGQVAAGKSTLARALLERWPFGIHVDVDAIREMVTSGLASPLEWSAETSRQFGLAIEAASAIARLYHAAGFAVAIEGAIEPVAAESAIEAAGLRNAAVLVELHPPVEVALRRNRERGTKPFDPAILESAIRSIDADMAANPAPATWTRFDNGAEPLERTVERVLALVPGS